MDLVEIYKSLGEITRLRIVMLLLDKKMCGYHIENTLNVSQSNVSRHLTKLKYAKIIKEEKEGQKIYFSINPIFIEEYNLLYESLRKNTFDTSILISLNILISCSSKNPLFSTSLGFSLNSFKE